MTFESIKRVIDYIAVGILGIFILSGVVGLIGGVLIILIHFTDLSFWSYVILAMMYSNKKEKDINISGSYCRSFESLIKEVDKCMLLCANCHRIEHE